VKDRTTVHCPDCGSAVDVEPGASSVACTRCRTAFSPWSTPTAAARHEPRPSGPSAVPAGEDPLVGTTLGGRLLLRVIGRGGMGAVYEASDARRGRVAVKVLPADLAGDAQFVERFNREAAVLSGLSHPHLVEVYDRGQDGDRCYFVMEFVRGESLRRRLERGPVPWAEAIRVARDVLTGLGYAHGRGVIHRDLKPENVLLDDHDRARIVDFGLSRIVRGEAAGDLSRLTRTNVILGTYEYMAPEQRTGAPVEERADLYALGVILYEALTGALPLGRFDAPSALRPGIPSGLDAVVLRALATAPKDRFPSAAAFREALDAAERGAGRLPASPPARVPAPGNAATAPLVPDLPPHRLEPARKVIRHVEILAACDRVIGVVSILFFVGILSTRQFDSVPAWRWMLPTGGGILTLIVGLLLLRQASRIERFEPSGRTWQIVLSIPMLALLPPIGTALGIYGLITMSGEAARDAFALGRARLLGAVAAEQVARQVPRHDERRPSRRFGDGGGPRTFLIGVLLFTVAPFSGVLVLPLLFVGAVLAFVGLFHWIGLRRLAVLVLILAFLAVLSSVALRGIRMRTEFEATEVPVPHYIPPSIDGR
jgi:hypothetical protein